MKNALPQGTFCPPTSEKERERERRRGERESERDGGRRAGKHLDSREGK